MVCASLNDVGLESLEGGFLVHGQMCWVQRNEWEERLRDSIHKSSGLGRARAEDSATVLMEEDDIEK